MCCFFSWHPPVSFLGKWQFAPKTTHESFPENLAVFKKIWRVSANLAGFRWVGGLPPIWRFFTASAVFRRGRLFPKIGFQDCTKAVSSEDTHPQIRKWVIDDSWLTESFPYVVRSHQPKFQPSTPPNKDFRGHTDMSNGRRTEIPFSLNAAFMLF